MLLSLNITELRGRQCMHKRVGMRGDNVGPAFLPVSQLSSGLVRASDKATRRQSLTSILAAPPPHHGCPTLHGVYKHAHQSLVALREAEERRVERAA
jgi:hypothetical protein